MEAESLEDAKTIVSEEPIDVVLIDLNLRDGLGRELIHYTQAPVILITGASIRDRPGIAATLQKPFRDEVLLSTIKQVAT